MFHAPKVANFITNKQIMRKITWIAFSAILIVACRPQEARQEAKPDTGPWRAEVIVKGDNPLPFNFYINYNNEETLMTITNGDERIEVTQIVMSNDSIRVKLPVYDSEIHAALDDDTLTGRWYNYSKGRDYWLPFRAVAGQDYRFFAKEDMTEPAMEISGKWEATFSPGSAVDERKYIGLFQQNGNYLTGTFDAPTGDKRFLEGCVTGDSMFLSTYDGAFAYLFKARVGDTIRGMYHSSKTHQEPWIAVRNEEFQFGDEAATQLTEGTKTLPFTFPDPDSNLVSSDDEQFKNKVLVVEVMGSWCANCKDEARLLNDLYAEYHDQGLEIVSLAYERTDDFQKERPRVKKMVDNLRMPYPVLYAGSTRQVTETLPIKKLGSYPTTFFIDRSGKVRKIHSGFSGPATGEAYDETVRAFRNTIEELLAEGGS